MAQDKAPDEMRKELRIGQGIIRQISEVLEDVKKLVHEVGDEPERKGLRRAQDRYSKSRDQGDFGL